VVLDEVDGCWTRVPGGHPQDLDQTPKQRQTVFVSATISPDIEKLARRYMVDPEKVIVQSGSLTVSLVEQHYLAVNQWTKKRLLCTPNARGAGADAGVLPAQAGGG